MNGTGLTTANDTDSECRNDADGEYRLRETIKSYNAHPKFYADRYCREGLGKYRDEFLAALPDGIGRVLDGGCGPGRDCLEFDRSGVSVVGLDLAMGLLRIARRSVSVPLVCSDLRVLPFASNSFDGVWLCASLLHLSPVAVSIALREANRVLVPKGVLFASVVTGESGWRPDPCGGRRWFVASERLSFDSAVTASGLELIGRSGRESDSEGGWINILARKDHQ
jgi:SAM-dependent methyltransferase